MPTAKPPLLCLYKKKCYDTWIIFMLHRREEDPILHTHTHDFWERIHLEDNVIYYYLGYYYDKVSKGYYYDM